MRSSAFQSSKITLYPIPQVTRGVLVLSADNMPLKNAIDCVKRLSHCSFSKRTLTSTYNANKPFSQYATFVLLL